MLEVNVCIWMLILLCAGTFCEEYLNGCAGKPCRNGGLCESHKGESRCLCSRQIYNGRIYGGETCSTPLVGCDSSPCQNGGACSPLLLNEQHTYSCFCLAGFSGTQCQLLTVFSFESSGYIHVQSHLLDQVAPLNVTFSFRTQRPVGTLLQCWVDDTLLSVDLVDGRLRLSSTPSLGTSQVLPEYVADGRWHTAEALLGSVGSLVRLLCLGDSCTTQATPQSQVLEQGTALRQQGTALPEQGTALPEQGTSVRQQVTTVPDQGTSVPEQGTSVPEQETSVPEQGTAVPEQQTSVPEQGTAVPEQQTSVPEQGTSVPEQETSVPEQGTAVPEQETAVLEQGTAVPDQWTAVLEQRTSVPEQETAVPEQVFVRRSLFIGAAELNWGSRRPLDQVKYPAAFLGCFRDVLVNSRQLVPAVGSPNTPTQVNVTMGCSDKNKCDDSPCAHRGRCVNHGWRSYVCECHRPYEGPDCTEEYVAARFGGEDSASYAVFSMEDSPGSAVTVSMFLRTRRRGGLVLVLANSTSQYLRVWLEHGRVKVLVHNFYSVSGRSAVSDGHFHLVTVRLDGELAILLQSSQTQGSVAIQPVHAQNGDGVIVGGLTDERASVSFGGYFKGCIQDLRINSRHLQFFPTPSVSSNMGRLEQLVNVTPGCSSQNTCAVSPCLNGGLCYSTWDDFACLCPANTAGRRCEEVEWCALSPCPATAACRPVSQGFECVSNVTLGSAELSVRGNGRISRRLTSVLFSFRTRQSHGTLIHAENGPDYCTVSLWDGRPLLELRAGGRDGSSTLSVQGARRLDNGEWHTVEIAMTAPELRTSPWVLVVDRDRRGESLVSGVATGNLDFLRDGVDILLGGLGPEAGGSLAGCLGPVEIGGLLLPFYGDAELTLRTPQEERFVRVSSGTSQAPRYGCWGASVCSSNPCQNQGECEDLFNLSHCKCPSGWTGPLCEVSTDYCASAPCSHGNCRVLADGYRCLCEEGYTGTRCEAETNVCDDNRCALGATCLRGVQHYACLCPQNQTGPLCDEKIPELPWYIEMSPAPILPASLCFGSKWNYNCFNGGKCSQLEYTCDCLPGFTGQWCEVDVDECESEPCMYGALCRNMLNSFHCLCDLNYSGEFCQIDSSDFYYYVSLLLWQNMFQLMSYFFLHLDDGPEVDWGFQDD